MIIDRHVLHSFLASRAEDAAATATTAATTLVGWTYNPNTRGTAAIIYSCMSVLILCSYKCHHPPIPEAIYRYAKTRRVWGFLPLIPDQLTVHMLLMNLRDLVSLMVLPEAGVATALTEYSMARQVLHDVRGGRSFWGDDADGAGAAGSVKRWLRFSYEPVGRTAPPWTHEEMKSGLWEGLSLAHAFYAQMGGIVRIVTVNEHIEETKPLSLHEYVMFLRLSPRPLRKKYFLREGDIDALAKTDVASKALALMQSTWLLMSTVARHAQHLPITPLELTTCAYVLCAAAMYALWWNKPHGALQRLVLYDYDEAMHARIAQMYAEVNGGPGSAEAGMEDEGGGALGAKEGTVDIRGDTTHSKEPTAQAAAAAIHGSEEDIAPAPQDTPPSLLHHPPKHNWTTLHDPDDTLLHDAVERFTQLMTWNITSHHTGYSPTIIFYATTLAFGAVHLLAWSWTFPSPAARTLWRVLAVICTTAPVIAMLLPVLFCVSQRFARLCARLAVVGLLVVVPTYVIARIMTLILAFYCLRALPAETYTEVSWTTYLPSIA